MSENEKKHESQSCCCCQSWKALFIAIAFMAIGAVFGHVLTMMHMMYCGHHNMMGSYDGNYGREECRERGERECEGRFEYKFQGEKEGRGEHDEKGWMRHQGDMGKCKPGCTCPKCSKKAAGLSEPDKTSCPMTDKDKKEGKSKKD